MINLTCRTNQKNNNLKMNVENEKKKLLICLTDMIAKR